MSDLNKDNESDSWSDDSTSQISILIEEGYNVLDEFIRWLEENIGATARLVQQDSFNGELLMEYLAHTHSKGFSEINEYELRWFLYSYSIRKSIADDNTQQRLLVSLSNLFHFLQSTHDVQVEPWLTTVLQDGEAYQSRLHTYITLSAQDEQKWQEGFAEWCRELDSDLEMRCLAIPADLGHGLYWRDEMGWREATLREEASRVWQAERMELLNLGADFEEALRQLQTSYYTWTDMPQDKLDGFTPSQIIMEEREGRPERDDEMEEDTIP